MEGGITSLPASQGGNFCAARSSKEREQTVSADVAGKAIWDKLNYKQISSWSHRYLWTQQCYRCMTQISLERVALWISFKLKCVLLLQSESLMDRQQNDLKSAYSDSGTQPPDWERFKSPGFRNQWHISLPEHLFFSLSLPSEVFLDVKEQAAGKPNAICITEGEKGKKNKQKTKLTNKTLLPEVQPCSISGESQGVAQPWRRSPALCSKKSPPNSLPPQKAKPDKQLHILPLALFFAIRKCHLLPAQM